MTDGGHLGGRRGSAASARRRYDTIVIGTGIGGLTAAALLARSGQRVLALEGHDRVGGYAHSFKRGPYLFDAAVHLVGGCEDGGLIDHLLSAVGVRDRCDFEAVNPCYQTEFPDFRLAAPSGLADFTAAYQEAFADDARGIGAFVATCATIRDETRRLMAGDPPPKDARTLTPFPALQRYRRSTVSEVLGTCVSDERARAAITTLWPYVGLPPERLSFLYWASMLMSYVDDGAYYCKGTFQVFANALADVIRESGGDVMLRAPVRKVEIDGGGVSGVTLDNGARYAAKTVLSNADLRQTVDDLVGGERFPRRYRQSVGRMRPSVSALVGYLAVDLPADAISSAHETFSYSDWDHAVSYQSTLAGAPSWFTLTVPTRIDPSLAPKGISTVVFTTLVPFDAVSNWGESKSRYQDDILSTLDARVPGLSSRVRAFEVGTPRTMMRYTSNSDGALYGWELSPSQIGPGRPSANSPIPGLYLAGHWTQPGGGIYGVVTSGILAARAILGHETEDGLWRSLGQ